MHNASPDGRTKADVSGELARAASENIRLTSKLRVAKLEHEQARLKAELETAQAERQAKEVAEFDAEMERLGLRFVD